MRLAQMFSGIVVVLFFALILAACKPAPELREEAVIRMATAIANYDTDAVNEFALERGLPLSPMIDYQMADIWCEYQRLTEVEKEQMFTRRLENYLNLRIRVNEILGYDILRHGIRHSIKEWPMNQRHPEAFAAYKEYFENRDLELCLSTQ